jgi:hypothetical protein
MEQPGEEPYCRRAGRTSAMAHSWRNIAQQALWQDSYDFAALAH